MDRKTYLCSGCGKVIISGNLPHGWKRVLDNPEWYICDQCRGEMGTSAFQHEALSPFQEYVLWLRIKYLLCRYEIVDNALLLEYEQELIAVLREEIEDEFFWIEKCT